MEKGDAILSLITKDFKYSYLVFEENYQNKPIYIAIIPCFSLTTRAVSLEKLEENLDALLKSFFHFYFRYKGGILDYELERFKWIESDTNKGEFTFEYTKIPETIDLEKVKEVKERSYNFTEQYIEQNGN